MEYRELGRTGLKVSRLCFGALTVGPLQAAMSPGDGAAVLAYALGSGINFIDTAEIYGTYPHVGLAIRKHLAGGGTPPVVATKCYAYTREGAAASLDKARRETGLDTIDIFMLHEQESRLTLQGHMEASEYFLEAKASGKIKAFGVSTHRVEVVEAAAELDYIDVVMPIVNKAGLGVGDGTAADMLRAVERAHKAGKGVISMKTFGGGNLLDDYRGCLDYVLGIPAISSTAVGMQSEAEVVCNIAIFEGRQPEPGLLENLTAKGRRKLHADEWCTRCGKCVARCAQGALSICEGRLVIDHAKCLTCGYCSEVCPEFALKVF